MRRGTRPGFFTFKPLSRQYIIGITDITTNIPPCNRPISHKSLAIPTLHELDYKNYNITKYRIETSFSLGGGNHYVELNAEGIKHGFGAYASRHKKVVPTPAADRNARAAMLLPELLKNAVEVNRSSKYSGNGIDYGHVLLAVYAETDNAGNTEYNAVRIVVEHNSTIRSLL